MTNRLTKRHQREVVPRLAEELVLSGRFSNWWSIETHLRSEGYSEARWILDDENMRERLNDLCIKANQAAHDEPRN